MHSPQQAQHMWFLLMRLTARNRNERGTEEMQIHGRARISVGWQVKRDSRECACRMGVHGREGGNVMEALNTVMLSAILQLPQAPWRGKREPRKPRAPSARMT